MAKRIDKNTAKKVFEAIEKENCRQTPSWQNKARRDFQDKAARTIIF